MQVWLRDERSSEPMSGESLQVAPTLTRPVCPPRGAGMQHAHCATGAGCSGQRKMRWPAHLRGRHDQVCARRAGGDDSQYAAVLRELLRAGRGVARRYSRALPLTVCAFERRRKRGSRGRSGAKSGRTRVRLPISSFSTIVQSNLISWAPASVDFTPESSSWKPPTRRLHGTRRRRRAALARGTRHPRQRRAPGVPSL